jgi:hypothetical protein
MASGSIVVISGIASTHAPPARLMRGLLLCIHMRVKGKYILDQYVARLPLRLAELS